MKLLNNGNVEVWFTQGPATNDIEMLTSMFKAGADGVRETFSFGTHMQQAEAASAAFNAAKNAQRECSIIADLEGEKMRLGPFGKTTHLRVETGEELRLVPLSAGFNEKEKKIPVKTAKLFLTAKEGDRLIVGDGSSILEVSCVSKEGITCKAVEGGIINPNRGLTLQSGKYSPMCMTDKDIMDLKYIAKAKMYDAVALSFVSKGEDVEMARKMLQEEGSMLPIIAKVETQKGVENIKEIAMSADAIMVARGDLALYVPWYELGNMVEEIVDLTNQCRKPWIMATQVAEGMERFSFPTRAEICDMSHWIRRGASAIMVSYETAFGPKPVAVVSAIRKIVAAVKPANISEELGDRNGA